MSAGPEGFTSHEIAKVLGVHERNVRKRAAKESWPHRERSVRGGHQRLYDVAGLPPSVQEALARAEAQALLRESIAAKSAGPAVAEALSIDFDSRPENVKQLARERLAIVQLHQELCAKGYPRRRAIAAVAEQLGVHAATVKRCVAIVRGKPEHLWVSLLAPNYAGRSSQSAMSVEAWEILKADYLRPERPTASACIARLVRSAQSRPDWVLPSTKTMARRLAKIPRTVQVLARQGVKALQDLYPAQQRSRAQLSALEIINGDGYKHNVWVRFPDGEVLRAKTWFWQDVYSAKILAWRTDKSEHTEMIRLAFGDVVDRFGIPEEVVLDNTLAAANKTMSGGVRTRYRFKVRDEEPDGVFKTLGCRVRWATPGHGQAKPIERAFGVGGVGEIIDKAPELAGAWTGPTPIDKPDYDGKAKAVEYSDLVKVIEREINHWNAQVGRRSHVAQGRSFDAVFAASYEQSTTIRKATAAQRRLWLLATEPVRANRRDGSISLESGRIKRTDVAPTQSNRYWSQQMIEFAGKQVVARFDPQQLHVGVHVYTLDGRYLCFAECHAPVGFNDSNAAREHARNRRKFMKNEREQLELIRRMRVSEAAKHLAATPDDPVTPSIPAPPKVVVAQFGHPMARPAYVPPAMTEEERAGLEKFEREFEQEATRRRRRPHQVTDINDQWDLWVEIDALRTKGEALDEDEELFWKQFQTLRYFRDRREAEEEFERKARSA